jgi:hypothetical protein
MLEGTVEVDHFYIGGQPKKRRGDPPPGRGRKGLKKTRKTAVLAMVQRPGDSVAGTPAGDARAAVVTDLSYRDTEQVLEPQVTPTASLVSDEWKAFMASVPAGGGMTP